MAVTTTDKRVRQPRIIEVEDRPSLPAEYTDPLTGKTINRGEVWERTQGDDYLLELIREREEMDACVAQRQRQRI